MNCSDARSINFFMKKENIHQKKCQGILENEKPLKNFPY